MENNGIGKLFEGVDRWTVLIYVLIVLVGFVAILSASYEEGAESIFSFSHFYMKQLVSMGISFAWSMRASITSGLICSMSWDC